MLFAMQRSWQMKTRTCWSSTESSSTAVSRSVLSHPRAHACITRASGHKHKHKHAKRYSNTNYINICKTRTHTVREKSWVRVLYALTDSSEFLFTPQAKEEAIYKEKVEFVSQHKLFRSWSVKLRRLLEMSLKKEVCPQGTVLMRQGQPPPGLIFILR